MLKRPAIICAAALSVAWSAAAGADETPLRRMEQSDDGHLRPQIRERLPEEVIPPRVRFGQSYRVYSFRDPISKVAKIDRTLSRLCQRGAFIQQLDGMYWAQTPERRYGVAFSGGANLVDPQNRRQPAEVYFFHGQDSFCSVYVAKQEAVMAQFVAPRSRLPVLGPSGIPAPAPPVTETPNAPPPPPGAAPTPGEPPYR